MPGLNGTGPLGQGSMTGRGLGVCNPNANSVSNVAAGYGTGFRRGGAGFGRGFNRGIGRGFNRGFGGVTAQNNEFLMEKISILEQRLAELESKHNINNNSEEK
ncbi:MAG: DUF5320 domain-containing protein [Candidatus Muiribacteriota bacterium]